jgi:hypothetical protein
MDLAVIVHEPETVQMIVLTLYRTELNNWRAQEMNAKLDSYFRVHLNKHVNYYIAGFTESSVFFPPDGVNWLGKFIN